MGRCPPAWRTGVDVHSALRGARDGAAHRVGDAHAECPVVLGVLESLQRVRRLARLADEHRRVVAEHRALPVQHVARELKHHGHLHQLLHRLVGPKQASAGTENKIVDLTGWLVRFNVENGLMLSQSLWQLRAGRQATRRFVLRHGDGGQKGHGTKQTAPDKSTATGLADSKHSLANYESVAKAMLVFDWNRIQGHPALIVVVGAQSADQKRAARHRRSSNSTWAVSISVRRIDFLFRSETIPSVESWVVDINPSPRKSRLPSGNHTSTSSVEGYLRKVDTAKKGQGYWDSLPNIPDVPPELH